MIKGQCECGEVRFEVDGDIKDFSHCHCSQCRRLHGAAYATFAGVLRDQFRFVTGESRITRYASSEKNTRWFCSICGSTIGVDSKPYPETIYLSMSAVEGNPGRPEGYHIYVGSKAPWHEITDNLKQYVGDVPD